MAYLITGVTGGLGAGILAKLSQQVDKADIAVLVRSEEKGKPFKYQGYDVRIADYSDKDKLTKAFTGVDTLMFVSGAPGQATPRQQQHQNVIEAAQSAGAKNIVYTSISNGEESTAVLAPDHIFTEKLIKNSGLHYKILRNNWYLENELDTIKAAINGGAFIHAGGQGKVGWALKSDYAQAAANALVGDFSQSRIYELAGKRLSYDQLAQAVKEVSKVDFDVLSLSDQDFRQGLAQAGLSQEVIDIVAGIQTNIRQHQLEVDNSDLESLLERPQVDIHDALKEVINL